MFENREGQRVPQAVFKTREGSAWRELSSADIFDGRTVIVFSLPGAFTPTCSSSHVPRYNELTPLFKANGIDDIVCVSVNDAFVMQEWQQQQQADQIRFLPDGSGTFTRGMGMLVDRDGLIEKMFIEPSEPGDPFHVSDADTMLAYAAPTAEPPLDVALLTRPGCPHCERAKIALRERGIDYVELELHRQLPHRALRALSGAETIPQVFIDGVHIGGADDLDTWLEQRRAA